MQSCRIAVSCFLFFLFFWGASVSAQDPPAQTPPQQAVGFKATFTSATISSEKNLPGMKGTLYAAPPLVRFEPDVGENHQTYNEILLYDFETQIMRRVFLDDKIYFELQLTENNQRKAMVEGWIPWKDFPNIKRRRIRLKEDFVNGHPCVLVLQEREAEISTGKKSTTIIREYILRWEATDLKNLPVRIIYFPWGQGTTVVDFKNVELGEPDQAKFNPPEGFLNLSPF